GGGGNSSFQPLKRFTLFSCSSLIFTGLLTTNLNAKDQDIIVTNKGNSVITKYHQISGNRGEIDNITVKNGGSINRGRDGGGNNGVSVGLYFYNAKNITIENGGHLGGWIRTQNATIDNIIFNGSSDRGIQAVGNSHLKNVTLGHGGTMAQGIILNAGTAKIDNLTIQGAITGSPGGNWGGIHNTGTIGNVNIANGARVERGIRNNNTMQTLLVSGNVNGGVNNSGTLTTLNLNNGGTINGGINNNRTMGSISVSDSTVNGGINNNANSTLNNITIETNGNVNGGIHNRSSITNNVTIKGNVTGKVTNAGTITGNITISDGGTIDASNASDPQNAIDNSGTIQGKIEVVGQNSNLNKNIKNSGNINQGIEIKDNAVIVGIDNSGTVDSVKVKNGANITGDISNTGTVTQKIELTQNSTIQGSITNTNKINGIDIANSQIGGNIVNSGQNANTGNISITGTSDIKGSIVNQNGANFTNSITLDQSSKLGGISNNA
ncbi:beta strand repeat-containing protein, partial [Campylobacter upsaliensis]